MYWTRRISVPSIRSMILSAELSAFLLNVDGVMVSEFILIQAAL